MAQKVNDSAPAVAVEHVSPGSRFVAGHNTNRLPQDRTLAQHLKNAIASAAQEERFDMVVRLNEMLKELTETDKG